jgi:hypothetical protein
MSVIQTPWRNIRTLADDPTFARPRDLIIPRGSEVRAYNTQAYMPFDKQAIDLVSRCAMLAYNTKRTNPRPSYSPADIPALFENSSIMAFSDSVSVAERSRGSHLLRGMSLNTLMIPVEVLTAMGDDLMDGLINNAREAWVIALMRRSIENAFPVVLAMAREGGRGRTSGITKKWDCNMSQFDIRDALLIAAWDPHASANFLSVMLCAQATCHTLCLDTAFSHDVPAAIPSGVSGLDCIADVLAAVLLILTQLTDQEYMAFSAFMGVPTTLNLARRRRDYNKIYVPESTHVHGLPVPTSRSIPACVRLPVECSSPVSERESSFDDDEPIVIEDDEVSIKMEEEDPDLDLRCDEDIPATPSTPILYSEDDDPVDAIDSCHETELLDSSAALSAEIDVVDQHFFAFYDGEDYQHQELGHHHANDAIARVRAAPRRALSLGDRPVFANFPVTHNLADLYE